MTQHQQKVYLYYVCKQLALKHDFAIIELTKPHAMTGRGPMDSVHGTIGFKYHWRDLKVLSFEELVNGNPPYDFTWYEDLMSHEKK